METTRQGLLKKCMVYNKIFEENLKSFAENCDGALFLFCVKPYHESHESRESIIV